MKDDEIIEKIKKGDESAIDFLYQKYFRMMLRLVQKNSGTEEEAKDIYQEALIVFWQKVVSGQLVLSSKISTYLYSICRNLWHKELERKRRYSSGETKENTEELDVHQKEHITIIHKCIHDLGETCKHVLSYYYFDGMSMNDIAEKLGFANADTAKTKKYKCKKELDKLVKSRYTAADFLD